MEYLYQTDYFTRMNFTRRQVNKIIAGSAAIAALPMVSHATATATTQRKDEAMSFSLPELPYAKDALEPYMSAETFSYHYDKHHAAYINKLNDGIIGTEYENMSLEEIILATAKKKDGDNKAQGIFNNAAQTWNHTFFWHSMTPNGGGKPSGKIAEMINSSFGSYDEFAKKFKDKATSQFGSGWAWLVVDGGKLDVINTANADLPMAHGKKAVLTIDVWEHAYYLDYQNRRPDFVDAYLEHLVNWGFAEKNLG